ncbi:MAG: lipopolysaccharide kinase InaA family protein [Fimbriiglobus sp.]|nr:lipopolysaccharide kinase InaA family protein [Fimbriiglobus sp.]
MRDRKWSDTPHSQARTDDATPSRGKFVAHPRYRAWLARCGVTSAETALALSGEVVSGHADRHVVRVELRAGSAGRTAYLKREHVTGLKWRAKNWAAGFGWVSRCEREAATLESLEASGLPGPQWLAYGEDDRGRAFVLVDGLAKAVDLPTLLRDAPPTADAASELFERIGTSLAELHAAGFGTPDLAAKHLFIGDDNAVSLIDWPSTPKPGTVRPLEAVRWLGTLNASIDSELATTRDRLRVLWAYRRAYRRLGQPVPARFGEVARAIANRRGRANRHPVDPSQRLVWLAGERVVAIPEVASDWPKPAECPPFYPPTPTKTPLHGHREWVTMPNGTEAVLVRFQTTDPFGRLMSVVRERPWRSPAAIAARVLFHLQRHAIPAPRLLAFGQRLTSRTVAESFLCAEMPRGVSSLSAFLSRPETTPSERAAVLRECGRLLSDLHKAGLRPIDSASPNDPLFVVGVDHAVSVGSPFAVRLVRRITQAERTADLARFVSPLDPVASGWVNSGYHGAHG